MVKSYFAFAYANDNTKKCDVVFFVCVCVCEIMNWCLELLAIEFLNLIQIVLF